MPESEKARAKRLLEQFKLTPDLWAALDAYQKGLCFFCGKRQASGKRLATDHDHATGEVRGLLCAWCNRLLGKVERFWSTTILRIVIGYLENPPARSVFGKPHIGYPGRVTTKKHRRMLKRMKKLEAKSNQGKA